MSAPIFRRDLWFLGGYLCLLFSTIPVVPFLWGWLGSFLSPWHLLLPEGAALLLALLTFKKLIAQRGPFLFLRGGALTGLLFLFFGTLQRLELAVEKIHFSEYGLLSFLVFRLFRHRFQPRWIYVWTLPTVCLIGVADELFQGIFPNRVFDPRDIGFNSWAGLLGLSVVVLLFDPLFLR